MKHLSLGVSEKRNEEKFAGTHGEGFKLAALVFSRNGRGMRITSSSFYWNFGFRGKSRTMLSCRLSKVKESKLHNLLKQYMKQSSRSNFVRGLTSNVWEDVTVTISKARGDYGIAVSEGEFKDWMQVTLELNPPARDQIVHTESGDLILDSRFKGLMYLKGLQIAGHEMHYVYGYNFKCGAINRDRDRLADLEEEKNTLSRIWGDAILQNDAKLAGLYIDILQKHKRCAETLWTSLKLTRPAVEMIWQRLRESNSGAFFYYEDESSSGKLANDQAALIRTDFHGIPFPVSKALWDLLRKHSLARTPEEEQIHRFKTSSTVPSDRDPLHIGILQALKACLSLATSLSSLDLCFVDGGGTQLDLMLDTDKDVVKIHEKWLCFDRVHKETPCDVFDLVKEGKVEKQTCFCEHVVEDLFEQVLNEIGDARDIPLSRRRILRGQARSCLRSMPRSIRVSKLQGGALEVTWIGNENGIVSERHSDTIQYFVVLHKESTCGIRRNDLQCSTNYLASSTNESMDLHDTWTTRCGCLVQRVSAATWRATFTGLSSRQKYFPMVARAGKTSFFGCPPQSISPKPSSSVKTPRSARTNTSSWPSTQVSPSSNKNGTRTTRLSSTPAASSLGDFDITSRYGPDEIDSPAEDTSASEYDQKEWQNWFQNCLLHELAKLSTYGDYRDIKHTQSVASLECPYLNFHFEKDEYAYIQLGSSGRTEFAIFVHEIFSDSESFGQDTSYLLVTRYSLLKSTLLLHKRSAASQEKTSDAFKEVVLHFKDHNKMGAREDAEIIKLNDITSAKHLTVNDGLVVTEIDHLVTCPQDSADPSMFCRFAIGTPSHETQACLTPVASHLLLRKDRWKEVRFASTPKPVVYEFSPGVLGPSEGLSQAGFEIELGLGFDPSRHLTWKERHHTSKVYDGSVSSILKDLDNGELHKSASTNLLVPKVAVVAGSNVPFRLNDQNQGLPSLENFLETLDKVEAAAASTLKPSFTVMLASPAMIHPKAVGRLNTTILQLLEQRLSVHIKICSLQDQGLPFQRDVLVLIASSTPSLVPWSLYWPSLDQPPVTTIETLIHDLSFQNPRATDEPNSGFVCLNPATEGSDLQNYTYIHNHRTGHKMQNPIFPEWGLDKLETLTIMPALWAHPSRFDRLTVRELARLQGFPDDFIFYHSEEQQYKDVWAAFPPVISKLVGQTIRYMLQRSQAIKMGDRVQDSRGQKRARLD